MKQKTNQRPPPHGHQQRQQQLQPLMPQDHMKYHKHLNTYNNPLTLILLRYNIQLT